MNTVFKDRSIEKKISRWLNKIPIQPQHLGFPSTTNN